MPERTVDLAQARGPDGTLLYAIGDVHGRLDLLAAMHHHIAAEIELALFEGKAADWRIVHLGDYVDRGPDSKGVLDFLVAAQKRDARNVMLAGNHDVGFLGFLEDPARGQLFLNFGGVETARSYGVELYSAPTLEEDHADLLSAIPDAHMIFLRALDFSVIFGDFFFCHAGIRPGRPLDRQRIHDLIWIRDEFLDNDDNYTKVVVHGHTPASEAELRRNRINVDTRAYETGRLTALAVNGAKKRILSATNDGVFQRSAAVTP
ncbi:metallophosphoesterase [Manganibacter manganicus]|uniref:Metallophosphatase n=1 Tax=Manganibacter manganicus TaxID=1873176 RepID=A0A1V8RQ13_9HYPH|nr:metallophosphoesterase [Pseudaminobacter manganicus]OQM75276.1 metallophosphatase [Pseudaminobacter manganicus]